MRKPKQVKLTGKIESQVRCPHCQRQHKVRAPIPPLPFELETNTPRERQALVAYLLAPITFKVEDVGGRVIHRRLSARRKLYWWHRLKGYAHGKAMLCSGYTRAASRKGRNVAQHDRERRAVAKYWRADELGHDFIKHHLVQLIEDEATKAGSKVSALNLASKITKLIRDGLDIHINQRMPVQVLSIAPEPRWCHQCGALQRQAEVIELPAAEDRAKVLPPPPGPEDVKEGDPFMPDNNHITPPLPGASPSASTPRPHSA